MGHIDGGDAHLLLDAADLRAHGHAELGVQIGQRLVEQQHAGFDDQRPRQRHALLLTAGQLVGHTTLHARQLHQIKDPHDPLLDLVLGHLPQLQAVGHVVEYVVVRQQGVALEHHGGVPLVGCQLVDGLVAQIDLALVGAFKACDHAQGGGLAAAGGPQQRHKAARLDGQGGILHRVEILAGLGILIDLGYMLEPNALFHFFHGLFLLLELSAGAEVLDEQVHQQHRAVGDNDQDGGEGAGQTVRALLRELVDLHGDQQELRRHQQDDGGNSRDAADEGRHQTAEERILDEGQRHRHEHLEAVRAHVVGGLLNGFVDLPQGGDAASRARGQRAHHKHDDEDQSRAVQTLQKARVENAVGEAADIAHTQYRARHRHGQHGHGLDKALAPEFPLDHQIGDDHAQQRRDGRGDQAQHKGVAERLEAVVPGEHQLEPFGGQREELEAPGGEERADGHADIHQDHEARRQRAQDGQRRLDALVLDEHPGAGRLAGQGGGGLALQIVLLHDEHGQRDAQQHHGHSRRARLVVGAGDLQVDGGGQRVVGAADDHGVGKIGDGLDERHQEGVAQTGQHQRQRHAGEYLPAGGAHVPCRFLQRRVDVLQKSLQHHVAHREERQRLDDDDAPEAVHAVVINAQQEPGDDARLAEQHDHGQGQHEGRGDYRQHGHDLEKAAHKLVHADVDLHIGEQQADESGQNAHQKTHLQRVGNGAGKGRHLENALEDGKTEGAVSHKTIHQQYGQRVEDKQSQKGNEHDDGGHHDGVGHQFFSIQRRALGSCHGQLLSHPERNGKLE